VNGSALIDGIRPNADRRHSSAPPPKNKHVAPSNHPIGRNTKDEVRPEGTSTSVPFGNLLKSSPSGPVDSVLAAVVIALVGFGVIMVYSASAIEATVRHHDAQFFLKRQAIYALSALFTMWLVSRFDYRKLRPFTYPILATVTALLGLTVLGLGHRAGNAYRWIALGPIHVQPAEMAKLGIVMWLAYSISKKADKIKSFYIGFVPHLLVVGFFAILLLKQPDFGSAVVLFLPESGRLVLRAAHPAGTEVSEAERASAS